MCQDISYRKKVKSGKNINYCVGKWCKLIINIAKRYHISIQACQAVTERKNVDQKKTRTMICVAGDNEEDRAI